MSCATTTQALEIAIESVQHRNDLSEKTKDEAVAHLHKLLNRDWYGKWDKDSIIKALMDYKMSNMRNKMAKR